MIRPVAFAGQASSKPGTSRLVTDYARGWGSVIAIVVIVVTITGTGGRTRGEASE